MLCADVFVMRLRVDMIMEMMLLDDKDGDDGIVAIDVEIRDLLSKRFGLDVRMRLIR